MVISFGLISICTAFCRSLGSACAVRFLLVAFEAGMLPGVAVSSHLRWSCSSLTDFAASITSLAGTGKASWSSAFPSLPR